MLWSYYNAAPLHIPPILLVFLTITQEPLEPSSSSDPPAPPHHPFTPTGSTSLKPGRRLQLRLERLPASVVQAAHLGLAIPLTECDSTNSQKVMCEVVEEEQAFTHCSSLTHSQTSVEHTQSSVLTPQVNGYTQRGKLSQGTMNKIRVDFKVRNEFSIKPEA